MRRNRLIRGLAALTAAVALLATGCSAGTSEDSSPGAQQGPQSAERVRLAGLPNFGYPSPFAWVRGPGWLITGMSFDTLLWEDSTGDPIPWLASDWEESPDGLQWSFTLRDNARWQDGRPVTAQDVAFTVKYMTEGPGKGEGGFAARGLKVVRDVAAEGDRRVVFRLKQPSAAFVDDVAARVYIIPEHIWADVTDPGKLRGPEATMGSGPYRLESLDDATGSMLYVANEDFYLGEPQVERLEFLPADDELAALQRGELDAAEVGLEDPVPQQQLDAFEADLQVQRLDAPGSWNRALHFNLDAGFPYDDGRFRHAVAYAIDREDLIERVMFGRGTPGSAGGLAPTHPYLADGLPTYDHDAERARRLLDELGMVDADGDGFRDLPDGSAFRPELLASNRFSARTPELIREYLRDVGIDTTVRILDQAAADEVAGTGAFTMTLAGYGGLMGDPDSLRTRYSSQGSGGSFSQATGYANPEFERLADAQLATTDPQQRRSMIVEMQRMVAADLPLLSLYVPDDTMFYNQQVFGSWYFTPGCSPCGGTRNKHMFVTGQQAGF
ncbi:MAG: hypothetical protein GEU83_18740 [Pseudonocardiaceae bacterium]|nr:hypothetical protein [Pseudonocardiaceae bacterium]